VYIYRINKNGKLLFMWTRIKKMWYFRT